MPFLAKGPCDGFLPPRTASSGADPNMSAFFDAGTTPGFYFTSRSCSAICWLLLSRNRVLSRALVRTISGPSASSPRKLSAFPCESASRWLLPPRTASSDADPNMSAFLASGDRDSVGLDYLASLIDGHWSVGYLAAVTLQLSLFGASECGPRAVRFLQSWRKLSAPCAHPCYRESYSLPLRSRQEPR